MINQVCWTDYPFTELGDEPGKLAPIRKILPLSYDGDKYCKVLVDGIKSTIKAGYIYTKPGRSGQVPAFKPTKYFT